MTSVIKSKAVTFYLIFEPQVLDIVRFSVLTVPVLSVGETGIEFWTPLLILNETVTSRTGVQGGEATEQSCGDVPTSKSVNLSSGASPCCLGEVLWTLLGVMFRHLHSGFMPPACLWHRCQGKVSDNTAWPSSSLLNISTCRKATYPSQCPEGA